MSNYYQWMCLCSQLLAVTVNLVSRSHTASYPPLFHGDVIASCTIQNWRQEGVWLRETTVNLNLLLLNLQQRTDHLGWSPQGILQPWSEEGHVYLLTLPLGKRMACPYCQPVSLSKNWKLPEQSKHASIYIIIGWPVVDLPVF